MLRPATVEDVELLFGWVNDPATRGSSFSSAPVSWDDHVVWFHRLLADADRVLWVLEDGGRPVASIRFEGSGDGAVVSVQVAPEHRGRGHGRRIVAEASMLYASATGRVLGAGIKAGNAASLTVFESAGYQRGPDRADGSRWYVLDARPREDGGRPAAVS
jgi:RimJ/RimL family protein N-acetyltransferase